MGNRVLIVLPRLGIDDGTATAIMNYYDAIVEAKMIVDFMVLKDDENRWKNIVINNGGKIIPLPKKNKYSISVNRSVRKVITEGNYDIVHINIPGHIAVAVLNTAISVGCGIRIFHVHNPQNTLSMKARISNSIYDKFIMQKANYLFACSKSAGESRFQGKEFYIVKNVINPEKYRYNQDNREEIRNLLGIENRYVIGVVGRISKQKNPEFIIKCFEALHKIRKDVFLLWIGNGEMYDNVLQLVEKMGLNDDVYFAGIQSNIGKWYAAMDMFFLPSIFEGLGIVFLEAQCNGLPCVGSSNVPVDTEISSLMHRYSLKEPVDYWVKQLYSISLEETRDRAAAMRFVIEAGLTHENTKYDLLNIYKELLENYQS